MTTTGRYDHLSKEALVALLERRDAQRSYGLVWEREGIDRDRALNDDFVALDLDPQLSTPPQDERGWRNLVIEGDNWDALRALRLTHAGRVKCILIDPPYNTGNQDFVYNDRYVGPQDRYRQSQWLEFLYNRFVIARDLLAPDGVVLVCINEENRARLDLMMEKAFPGMRVGSFVWRTRTAGGGTGDKFLSIDHEHVLIYGGPDFSFEGIAKSFSMYRNEDAGGRWRIVSLAKRENRLTRPNSYYPLQDPETGVWYPCNPDRVWAFVRRVHLTRGRGNNTSIEDMIERKRVIFPKDNRIEIWETREALLEAIRRQDVPKAGNGSLLLREDLPEDVLDFFVGKPVGWGSPGYKLYSHEVQQSTQPISSLVSGLDERNNRNSIKSGTNAEGTRLLRQIFGGEVFSYPKPMSLMASIIARVASADDIVLDFFAGSGTTAHAVLSLNAEDEERRRFIMVSNTEKTQQEPDKNLCRDVCAERIRRVIDGYADVDGTGGDFAYLRARRLDWNDVLYDLTPNDLWALLQLRHDRPLGVYDPNSAVQVSYPPKDRAEEPIITFIPAPSDAAVAQLRRLAALGNVTAFTPAPGVLRDMLDMPNVPVEHIPDRLLAEFPRIVAGL